MIHNSSAQVVVIDDFHPVFLERLAQKGISYLYKPEVSREEVYDLIKDVQVVVVRSKINFDKKLISNLHKLKCIARGGAGLDNIDEVFALERGITLLNAPEGNRDAVAEHVVGLLLGLSKKIYTSANEVRQFEWNRESNRGWEIKGKTIGIIGFGNTGSALAGKLSGFDCRILVYDKFKPNFQSAFATFVGLEHLLAVSDVVSLHIPLNESTDQMVNAEFISQMKSQVVLINSSRGRIVKSAEVLRGINSGKIKSFATDVLENEDFNNLNIGEQKLIEDLYASNQVIVTPHIAGWSTESYERIGLVLSEKLINYTTKLKII